MPFFSILAFVYLADLGTKILVRSKMPLGHEIALLPFFSFTHVENTGIAFGLFQGMNIILSVLGFMVVSVMIVFSYKTYARERFTSLVLAGVLGGALGNLTDRLYYGRVTDFLDFYIDRYHWPVFNIADSAIFVGAILLIWHSFRRRTA